MRKSYNALHLYFPADAAPNRCSRHVFLNPDALHIAIFAVRLPGRST